MKRIFEAYPELNPKWLIDGEGEMIKSGKNLMPETRIKSLEKRLSVLEKKISDSKQKG